MGDTGTTPSRGVISAIRPFATGIFIALFAVVIAIRFIPHITTHLQEYAISLGFGVAISIGGQVYTKNALNPLAKRASLRM